MAHAPECDGPIYGCVKCGRRGLTIKQTFTHVCSEDNIDIDIEHQGDDHYVQADGGDIVFIEENGDGTARVVVYETNAAAGQIAWEGEVRVDFEDPREARAAALDELADNEDDEAEYHRLRAEAAELRDPLS